jgi:hypothetical protein
LDFGFAGAYGSYCDRYRGFDVAGAFEFLLQSQPRGLTLLALLASFCCHRYRGFDVRLYFVFSLTPVRGGTYFFWLAPSKQEKALHPTAA